MLKIARILIITICCILICVLGTVYSFIRFRNPSNVGIFARWFGRLHPLFGLKVEHRYPANVNQIGRCIYIGTIKTTTTWSPFPTWLCHAPSA